MSWVWAYLAIGAVFAAAAVVMGLRAREPGSRSGLRRPQEFLLTVALSLALWPLGLVLLMFVKRDKPFPEPPAFRPNSGDLLEELSLDEIETRERVVDPLGAVPDLPFGHLHASWAAFRRKIPEDAKLWSFRAERVSEFGRSVVREGYAFCSGANGIHICTVVTSGSAVARADISRSMSRSKTQ